MLDEPDQEAQLDHRVIGRWERRRQECAARRPLSAQRAGAGQGLRVESPRLSVHQLSADEVPRVKRLERMVDDHGVAGESRVAADRALDDVEQLADRHGRWAAHVGSLVIARVGDDQPLGRRQQRVEQHLAILRARVTISHDRLGEHQIIAVAPRAPRVLTIVEPEDAHHPVGHRAHRDERAHREVAGAEVGAGRTAAKPVGEQNAHIGQLE